MQLSALTEDKNAGREALKLPMYLLRVREGIIRDMQGHCVMEFYLPFLVLPVSSIDNLTSFFYERIDEN